MWLKHWGDFASTGGYGFNVKLFHILQYSDTASNNSDAIAQLDKNYSSTGIRPKRLHATTLSEYEYAKTICDEETAIKAKLKDVLRTMAALKAEKKKRLTTTEQLMKVLTRMITTFPGRDQLEITDRISQIVHERALNIKFKK